MRVPSTHVFPLLLATMLGACASAPKLVSAPAAAPAAARVATEVVPVDKLTGEQIVALQRQGYKLVNSNGQTLYCMTEARTGSRLQKDNICMTEREMVTLRERTERGLQNTMMQQPPKQGK